MTSREKLLAGLAAGMAALYLLVAFFLSPLLHRMQSIDLELAAARAALTHLRNVVRLAENMTDAGPASSEMTPGNTPIVALLRDIAASAGQGVAIRRLRPMPATSMARPPGDGHRAADTFTNLQVQIDCTGRLPDLMAFFERLESGNDLTRLRHFYLTPESGGQLHCQLIVMRMVAW
ncbi:MAG: hypothetical protein ONB53_21930 [candidate division KSB1 bacterium]|nr:hypothetical protein [candidate division KSB1 bacterium]MDZ7300437.1 hypothetical protein [candidate division KSB1 bacterium]MDZ7308716.1 hypothetical protein [candidate division KSB1 bacterium]MDZ7351461.1 hypothetical protein [candidate division KSB1 bacterium]MDZ7355820.1 hypothetical protein [candidate division KSB1 bacterium]